VFRAANGREALHPSDARIVGVASDQPFPRARVSVVPLDAIAAIGDMVIAKALPVAEVIERLKAHGAAH